MIIDGTLESEIREIFADCEGIFEWEERDWKLELRFEFQTSDKRIYRIGRTINRTELLAYRRGAILREAKRMKSAIMEWRKETGEVK
jgi:hypothetical protein